MKTFQGGETVQGTGFVAQYLVDSEDDLIDIPSHVAPGSTAYTADMSHIWQKANDGTWTSMGGST